MKRRLVPVIVSILRNKFFFGVSIMILRACEWLNYIVFQVSDSKRRNEDLMRHIKDKIHSMSGENKIRFDFCHPPGEPYSRYDAIRDTLWQCTILVFKRIDRKMILQKMNAVCDDYQCILRDLGIDSRTFSDEGYFWIFWNILKWSAASIAKGKITYKDVSDLTREFQMLIARKGKDLFGLVNGGITAEKIIYGPYGDLYLSSLDAVVRPGFGYYDILHSIAWMFYNSSGDDRNFSEIANWIEYDLCGHDIEDMREAKVIFALECLIFLGQDNAINRPATCGDGNRIVKVGNLVRFIRREY